MTLSGNEFCASVLKENNPKSRLRNLTEVLGSLKIRKMILDVFFTNGSLDLGLNASIYVILYHFGFFIIKVSLIMQKKALICLNKSFYIGVIIIISFYPFGL